MQIGKASRRARHRAERKRNVSHRRKAALPPSRPMQKVKRKEQLGRLAPECGFIAVQALECAVIELRQTQEAKRHLTFSDFGAVDG